VCQTAAFRLVALSLAAGPGPALRAFCAVRRHAARNPRSPEVASRPVSGRIIISLLKQNKYVIHDCLVRAHRLALRLLMHNSPGPIANESQQPTQQQEHRNMRKTLILIAIATVVAIGTTSLWAGTQTKKRQRDGTGTNCRITATCNPAQCVVCQGYGRGGNGGGKGTGDQQRKRDGSCLP